MYQPCTLCRNIIDNLATIYHVYMNSNEDEKGVQTLFICFGWNSL